MSKNEIFPGGRLQSGKLGESYSQGGGWLGLVQEEQAVLKWFPVNSPEVEGIDFNKRKMFGAVPWHDKMKQLLGFNRPGES
jgi:hypothetical protein